MASIVELVSSLPTNKFEELSRETRELRLYSFDPFESLCSINEQSDFRLSQQTKITSLEGLQRPITSVENTENVMRSGLTPLTKLTVVNHDIRSIGDVQYLTRLEYLNLSQNKIVSIAGVKFPSSFLQMLLLEGNLIASLQGVVFPDSLKVLILSDNKIASLEGVLFPNTLEALLLDHNQIANLRGAILPPPPKLVLGLEGLEIRDTAVVRAVHSYNKAKDSRPALPNDVTKIIMRHALQIPSFTRLVSLKALDLSHNQLTSLEGIDFLTSLVVLNLEDNKLTSLALKLPNLLQLITTDNQIVDYSGLEIRPSCVWTSHGGKRKKQRKQIKQTKKNNKKYRRKTKKNERRRQRVK